MLGTHRWTYRPVVTHLSGRGFISGEKRDREREKGRKKKKKKNTPKWSSENAPLFGFLSWWDNPSTLASNHPALWHKNTAKTSDPCECASHHNSLLGCWVKWIHASDASSRPAADALIFCVECNAQNHAFTLLTRITHHADVREHLYVQPFENPPKEQLKKLQCGTTSGKGFQDKTTRCCKHVAWRWVVTHNLVNADRLSYYQAIWCF